VRTADLVLFVLSAFEIDAYEQLREDLYANDIRLDSERPNMTIAETGRGGISVTTSTDLDVDEETVKEVLRAYGYTNADVTIREPLDVDRLIDGVMENRVYLPSIVAVNKGDLIDRDYLESVHENLRDVGLDPEDATVISAEAEKGLDVLTDRIWDSLELIRVYMDKPGRGVDYEEPLVLGEGETIGDACDKLGGRFRERFQFARVSGSSAKHDGQQVGKNHELADEDVLRIITRR